MKKASEILGSFFEDSVVGSPTPQPKAPHSFQLSTNRFGTKCFMCTKCGKQQNEGVTAEEREYCRGKR